MRGSIAIISFDDVIKIKIVGPMPTEETRYTLQQVTVTTELSDRERCNVPIVYFYGLVGIHCVPITIDVIENEEDYILSNVQGFIYNELYIGDGVMPPSNDARSFRTPNEMFTAFSSCGRYLVTAKECFVIVRETRTVILHDRSIGLEISAPVCIIIDFYELDFNLSAIRDEVDPMYNGEQQITVSTIQDSSNMGALATEYTSAETRVHILPYVCTIPVLLYPTRVIGTFLVRSNPTSPVFLLPERVQSIPYNTDIAVGQNSSYLFTVNNEKDDDPWWQSGSAPRRSEALQMIAQVMHNGSELSFEEMKSKSRYKKNGIELTDEEKAQYDRIREEEKKRLAEARFSAENSHRKIYAMDTSGKTPGRSFGRIDVPSDAHSYRIYHLNNRMALSVAISTRTVDDFDGRYRVRMILHSDTAAGNIMSTFIEQVEIPEGVMGLTMSASRSQNGSSVFMITTKGRIPSKTYMATFGTKIPATSVSKLAATKYYTPTKNAEYVLGSPVNVFYIWFNTEFKRSVIANDPISMSTIFNHSVASLVNIVRKYSTREEYNDPERKRSVKASFIRILRGAWQNASLDYAESIQNMASYCPVLYRFMYGENAEGFNRYQCPFVESDHEFLAACRSTFARTCSMTDCVYAYRFLRNPRRYALDKKRNNPDEVPDVQVMLPVFVMDSDLQ